MKSRLFFLTLIVAAIATTAWIAIPRFTLGSVAGAYALLGLLGIAAHDYSPRKLRRRDPRQPAPAPLPISNPDTWTCQTVSA